MENLDDFMRQKFNSDDPGASGRFEFREEYWEQAQVLIEANRKRRRRRWLLWWWWLFAGLLAAVGVWQWTGKNDSSRGGKRDQGELSGRPTAAGEKTASIPMDSLSKTGTENPDQKNGVESGNTDGNRPGSVGKHAGEGPDANNSPAGVAPSDELDRQKASRANKGASGTSPDVPKASRLRNGRTQPPGLPGQPASARPGSGVMPAGEKKPATTSPDQAMLDRPAPGQAAENGLAENNQTADPAGFRDTLEFLPVLLQLVDVPDRSVKAQPVDAAKTAVEPARNHRWHFGLAAYGTLLEASPDGKRLGGSGGAFVSRRLTADWSVVSGLFWRFLPGDWRYDTPVADSSTQLQYSFGFKFDRFELQTQGLHYVEIPLGIGWRQRSFGAEAGLAAGYLVSVRGRLVKKHSESLLRDGVRVERSQVSLTKTPYRRSYLAPYVGGEWQANRNLALSLRGAWQPGSLAKNASDQPPPGGIFRLDAGLKWRF